MQSLDERSDFTQGLVSGWIVGLKAVKRRRGCSFPLASQRFPFKNKVCSRGKLSKRTVSGRQTPEHYQRFGLRESFFFRGFRSKESLPSHSLIELIIFALHVCRLPYLVINIIHRKTFAAPQHLISFIVREWRVRSDNYFALERLQKQSLCQRKKNGKRAKNFPSSPSCPPWVSLFGQVLLRNSF